MRELGMSAPLLGGTKVAFKDNGAGFRSGREPEFRWGTVEQYEGKTGRYIVVGGDGFVRKFKREDVYRLDEIPS